MESSVWLIIGLIAGAVIGGVATWSISRARGGAVSVMKLKQENDRFRNEVTEHFVETARLINQMTDSYKQVFDHLSHGAETLVDKQQLAERMPPASGQEVRLGGFGSASAPDSDGQASAHQANGARDSGTAGRSNTTGRTPPAGKPQGRTNSGISAAKPDKADPLKSGSEKSGPGNSDSGNSGSGSKAASAELKRDESDSSAAGKASTGQASGSAKTA